MTDIQERLEWEEQFNEKFVMEQKRVRLDGGSYVKVEDWKLKGSKGIEKVKRFIDKLVAKTKYEAHLAGVNSVDKDSMLRAISLSVEAKEKEIVKLKSDISHAMGFCRGFGHPENYLEKSYPDLIPESITAGEPVALQKYAASLSPKKEER